MIAQPAFPFSRKKSLSPLSAGYTERVAQTWTIGRFGRSFPPTETILQSEPLFDLDSEATIENSLFP
jgi:hypothetical protein